MIRSTMVLQRPAAPLGSWTARIICPRLLQPTGRFRRRSLSLDVGHCACMRIVAIFGLGLLLLLVAFLGYHAVTALRSGAANAAGVIHLRRARPFMFWLTVMVQFGFALICLCQLLLGIGRLFR